jgi:hypothetical protein
MRSIVAKGPAHRHVSGHLNARGCGRGVAQAGGHWADGGDDMAPAWILIVPATTADFLIDQRLSYLPMWGPSSPGSACRPRTTITGTGWR